jgi:Zn-dependent M28 family amino/carboxypeptidase
MNQQLQKFYFLLILFACFSGHEDGLYGANFFAKNAGTLLDSVQWMVNLDMVGRLDTQQKPAPLYLRIPEKAADWLTQLELPKQKMLKTVLRPTVTPLDYTPFFEKGIKVVTLSTGVHPDYHKASDDAARINFGGMMEILSFTQKLLEALPI